MNKDIDGFPASKITVHGEYSRCNVCIKRDRVQPTDHRNPTEHRYFRARRLKMTYGISIEIYEHLAALQGGICGICGRPPKGRGWRGRLVVDHDHKTGTVRGLLCATCNADLGHYEKLIQQEGLHSYLSASWQAHYTKMVEQFKQEIISQPIAWSSNAR